MASRTALQQLSRRATTLATMASPSRTAGFSTMTKVLHQHNNAANNSNNNNSTTSSQPETHFGFQNVPESMKEALGMSWFFNISGQYFLAVGSG